MGPRQKVRDAVKSRAATREMDLEDLVLTADEVLAEFDASHPLEIIVPFYGALLTGQLGLLGNVRTWDPGRGVAVSRGFVRGNNPDGKPLPDKEQLSNAQLLQAGRPDINYLWFIDWIRAIQQLWNFGAGIMGYGKIQPMDRWGSLYWEVRGGSSLYLELVDKPARTANLILTLASTLQQGQQAFSTLVDREDERLQHGVSR